ncbi:MAG: hypothetical protein BEN18_01215 [Epulopiscium sp. Nuni2H_MBin001]|nr:MAG: hypothetical protein BEN18_01215 [Epulopiscium sp. Nuni2H_MBin001]
MMKGPTHYAVAVRKSDDTIDVDVKRTNSLLDKSKLFKLPIIRGMVVFVESLVLGTKTLTYSAELFGDEELEEESKFELWLREKLGEKTEKVLLALTMCLSFALAITIFMLLPMWLSQLFRPLIPSSFALNLIEGVFRITIFLLYMKLVSNLNDIQRTFQYHGAEHKTINCLEQDMDLTVENVRECTRLHKSCGTSFLFIVMVVSILVFSVFTTTNLWIRTIVRIIMVPIISGISYEFIRWARKNSNSSLSELVSKPGMWLQKEFTTIEPDDKQIEVAIAAVQGVLNSEGSIS